MNAKNHTHKAELKIDFHYYSEPAERWYVTYGDQIQFLDLAGDPYKWDADIREATVSEAVREAKRRHDEATAISQQLNRLLNPRRPSLLERLVGSWS